VSSIPASLLGYAGSISSALVTSGILWGVLQIMMNRRMRRNQHRKDEQDIEEKERAAEKAEQDRKDLLAEAQNTAQRTALDSANQRYAALMEDYRGVRTGLRELREASSLLINAFEGFLLRMRPTEDGSSYHVVVQSEEMTIARNTIMEARSRLF
jgi:hypothetical protein